MKSNAKCLMILIAAFMGMGEVANGNITALVNTNGVIVARYNYDPYGNLLGSAGPLAEANTYR